MSAVCLVHVEWFLVQNLWKESEGNHRIIFFIGLFSNGLQSSIKFMFHFPFWKFFKSITALTMLLTATKGLKKFLFFQFSWSTFFISTVFTRFSLFSQFIENKKIFCWKEMKFIWKLWVENCRPMKKQWPQMRREKL